jgi:hypothetical protein
MEAYVACLEDAPTPTPTPSPTPTPTPTPTINELISRCAKEIDGPGWVPEDIPEGWGEPEGTATGKDPLLTDWGYYCEKMAECLTKHDADPEDVAAVVAEC